MRRPSCPQRVYPGWYLTPDTSVLKAQLVVMLLWGGRGPRPFTRCVTSPLVSARRASLWQPRLCVCVCEPIWYAWAIRAPQLHPFIWRAGHNQSRQTEAKNTHIRRRAPDSEPRIISRFISQLWRNRIIPVLSLWIWVGRGEKILNGKRKDLCFYSAEIECYREWIRSPGCDTEEYSQGLFLDMVEWFQFSGTGIPSIWFHFIRWQRGQSWSASLLRNANQVALLLCVPCQQGASTCVVNTENVCQCAFCCWAWRMVTKGGERWDWETRWGRVTRYGAAATCRHTLLMLLQPPFGNGITLTLRSMVLDCDEYEGPSSPVTPSNGSGLFSITAPCFGKKRSPRRKLTFP